MRVLEVGSGFALAFCGKVFSDFGAEVIKVEPAGGDALRRAPPLVETGRGRESALFAWLCTNKRSITADPGTAAGRVRLGTLLAGCDVLLDGRDPAARVAAPLGADDPGLIACDLSWFGETGPYACFAGSDVVARALSGALFCTGPVEGPPDLLGGYPGETLAGLTAFIATAAALLSRAEGGRRMEANALEANLAVAEYHITQAAMTPESVRRFGRDRFFPTWPMGVYPCADSTFLGVTVVTPAQWRGFCDMLGLPELGTDPAYLLGPERIRHAAVLEAAFAPRLLTRTAQEWFAEGLARRLPIAVVPDMAQLLRTETHRARGAFSPVAIGAARFDGPTLPHRLTRTPPRAGGTAPFAGEHDAAPPPSPRNRPARCAERLPLADLTMLDLSMGWAGPLCTRLLGDLGATVLKVEARQYPDWWRGVDPRPAFFEQKQYEKNTRFNALNRNKLGITLDLTSAEGAALLKRLVRGADLVVENYAREVLPKLGLDWPVLSAEKPDLVMVSMPAFGGEGPWRDARAYGSTLEHASGLPSVAGEEGGPPVTSQLAYGDPVGGYNAAAAALVALLHRQRTGEGQHIDLSQVECMVQLTAPWLIAQSATGAPLPRLGSRDHLHVPQGCFACADPEGWLVVAVTEDAAWPALCRIIGREELGADPALATAAGRRAREAELEAAIAAWARGQDADQAMAALQEAGVSAGICRHPAAALRDLHLLARGTFQPTTRAFVGEHLQLSAPFRPFGAATPLPVRRPAPTLGEANAEVLGGRLGLTAAELARLTEAGVIGTNAVPVSARTTRASTG
jgi:crotonobetainyl-CoA:carnitine CoA-transferase CaiB-like acyl-CoA transferase